MMSLIEKLKTILGRPSREAPAQDHSVEPDLGPGIEPSAQATIDASRQRTRAFVRDAAVSLDTAPVDRPGDAQPPVEAEPDGDLRRNANGDRFQE